MKEYKLVLKILLPSILCAFIIYTTNISLEYSVLSFGLIIGLINWNHHKYKPLYGIILSVLVSFVSFSIAYFSFALTGNIFNFMKGDTGQILGLVTSTYLIAPLLVFLFYKFVFPIPKGKFTFLVIIISITLLVFQYYFFFSKKANNESLNSFSIWQIVMALALQLILYQKELKVLFKAKNR